MVIACDLSHSTRAIVAGAAEMEGEMRAYHTPELRVLGSFASLTLGNNGSCPDGGGRNNDQNSGNSNSQGTRCSEASNSN